MSAVPQEITLPSEQQALQTDFVGAGHPMSTLLNAGVYNHLKLVATHFAQSQLVPKHFQGKAQDVFIALHMAHRMGADPVMVLQNLYVVHGTPGWSAKFIIAQANLCKVFKGRIKFRYEGEELADVKRSTLKVTAYAVMNDGSDDVVDAVASMDMARAEGWTSNAKYVGLQRQMLSYRAATLLVRLYAPEVLMGVQVVDEIEDTLAAHGGPVLRTVSAQDLSASLVAPQATEKPPEPPVDEPLPTTGVAQEVSSGTTSVSEAPSADESAFTDILTVVKDAATKEELDAATAKYRDGLTDNQCKLFDAEVAKKLRTVTLRDHK